MDAASHRVISLAEADHAGSSIVGAKAANLARVARAGFHVPGGFCLSVDAYRDFVAANRLGKTVAMELGRKPLARMRWEELWDAALRVRSAFLSAPVPQSLASTIAKSAAVYGASKEFVVRSSAPEEDSGERSFAGLHESVVGVRGAESLLDAVRLVWSSLWSDAALLYRRELGLDIDRSAMAVLVQPFVPGDLSGVAFAHDPVSKGSDHAIVEVVRGRCADLVDGLREPQRYELDTHGRELSNPLDEPVRGRNPSSIDRLLSAAQLHLIHKALVTIEKRLGFAPDMEWTLDGTSLTVLQARPITAAGDHKDDRSWYLSLSLSLPRLRALADRVEHDLIPALIAEHRRMQSQALDKFNEAALIDAIEERTRSVVHWREVYDRDFIPLAHGVRLFGLYYNDAVRPQDPFEFVGALRGENLISVQRNRAMAELAQRLADDPAVLGRVRETTELAAKNASDQDAAWRMVCERLSSSSTEEADILHSVERILASFFNVSLDGERLSRRPLDVLVITVRMAEDKNRLGKLLAETRAIETDPDHKPAGVVMIDKLLTAVGKERWEEAREVLGLARLAWRLRDDDNVLLSRLETSLADALDEASARSIDNSRIAPAWTMLDRGRDVADDPGRTFLEGERARQLIGQPAAPGYAAGPAGVIRSAADLSDFKPGSVLVCDSIQPMMTHVVPLAAAVVERRGGMLIHGAIIARELGIPCVNGISRAPDIIRDGDMVSVDGNLGIVTVGEAELTAEATDVESRRKLSA